MSIPVVIHEGTARSPPLLIAPQPGLLRHVGESSVAVVVVQHVLPEVRAKNIVKAVIIVVPHADSARPSERAQPGLFCDVRECPVAIIFVQSIRRSLRSAPEPRAA